jgi:hypothetical protein
MFLPLYSKPMLGIILSIFGIIFGIIASIIPKLLGINFLFEWRSFETLDKLNDAVHWNFTGSNVHFAPYACGILLGYIIRKKPNIYLGGKIGESIIWIICGSMSVWAYFWHSNWFVEEPSQMNMFLHMAFGKLMWVAGLGWIIFACSTGRAGKLQFN